jgi:hypothetical protein
LATIHTKDAIVYLQGSGAAAVPLTEAAEVSIDIDYDTEPDTAFGDTWETRLKGINRWSGTISGNYDNAQALLFEAIGQDAARALYVYADRDVSSLYYYGTIWPRVSPSLPFGVAKFTASFEGDGQLAVGE